MPLVAVETGNSHKTNAVLDHAQRLIIDGNHQLTGMVHGGAEDEQGIVAAHAMGEFGHRRRSAESDFIGKRETRRRVQTGQIRRKFAISQECGEHHALQHAAGADGVTEEGLQQMQRGFVIRKHPRKCRGIGHRLHRGAGGVRTDRERERSLSMASNKSGVRPPSLGMPTGSQASELQP